MPRNYRKNTNPYDLNNAGASLVRDVPSLEKEVKENPYDLNSRGALSKAQKNSQNSND